MIRLLSANNRWRRKQTQGRADIPYRQCLLLAVFQELRPLLLPPQGQVEVLQGFGHWAERGERRESEFRPRSAAWDSKMGHSD